MIFLGLLAPFFEVAMGAEPVALAIEAGRGPFALNDLEVFSRSKGYPAFLGKGDDGLGQGMVAARLTAVPGSSNVFRGSVVAYANEVKEASLGVPADVLETHGAVSAESAEAMARGVRERLGADVAVAVTGVAGPGGGSEEKPVGLVFAHATGPDGDHSVRTELPGDREMIRGRATAASLHLVRRLLESRHTST
jgi:PncC family amidohydrolase